MSKFTLALDSQQINTFMRCPLEWFYKYYQHIRLSTNVQKVAADKGTLIHILNDLYYTHRGLIPDGNKLLQANIAVEAFRSTHTVKSYFPEDNGELEDFICKRWMLYVQRYLNNDFNVLVSSKGEVGVEVPFSEVIYEDKNSRYVLEGRIDLLNKLNNGAHAWVDHKSEGKYNPLYPYKTQFRTYALATGFNYGIINYIGLQEDKQDKLLKENKLFRRELITFSPEMIAEWKNKVINVFAQIEQFLKSGGHPDSKHTEIVFYQLKNESACSGPYDAHPCEFTYLDEEIDFDTRQRIKEFKYTKVEPWSPWSTNAK